MAQIPATQGDPQVLRLFYQQKHYHLAQLRLKTKENAGRLHGPKHSNTTLSVWVLTDSYLSCHPKATYGMNSWFLAHGFRGSQNIIIARKA